MRNGIGLICPMGGVFSYSLLVDEFMGLRMV